MKDQKQLIENTDWNFLIILDACRYDYFREENIFEGYLQKVDSHANCTYSFLHRNLAMKMFDTKVFSAHPIINSQGISPDSFGVSSDKNWISTDYFDSENIIDLWKGGHQKINSRNISVHIIDPRKVIEEIREINDFNQRNIIWLMDPHHPFIECPELPDSGIDRTWRRGNYSLNLIRKGYRKDLRITLENINKLLPDLFGEIVITSDHGDALGAGGRLFHSCGFDHPRIREVPWLVI